MSAPAAPLTRRTYFIGDACLCWSLGNEIDRLTSLRVLCVYRRLLADPLPRELGVHDVVPSYTALAVHADPGSDWPEIEHRVEERFRGLPQDEAGLRGSPRRHVLPVSYRGVDLPRVAAGSGLSVEEVAERHAAPEYLVAMIGFRPHFPYLLGLDPRLATPRLATPRLSVPAGAVAIGGEQTGVYPEASPGGWNIVGMTDPQLLAAVRPGDAIVFRREKT
jgi:KipI family sensor histidine kinase inhibitor